MNPFRSTTKIREGPNGLARWLVRASLPDQIEEEALLAFEDEFVEIQKTKSVFKAHAWALKTGWDTYYRANDSMFQLVMIIIAVAGIMIAI